MKIFDIHISSWTFLKSLMPWFSKSIYFLKTFPFHVSPNIMEVLKDFSLESVEKAHYSLQWSVLHSFSTNSLPWSPQILAGTQFHTATFSVVMWLSFSQWDGRRNGVSILHQGRIVHFAFIFLLSAGGNEDGTDKGHTITSAEEKMGWRLEVWWIHGNSIVGL